LYYSIRSGNSTLCEIISQFKQAFFEAKKSDRLNGYMERLANTCISASKEIRTKSNLTKGTVSTSYAVIQLLKRANISEQDKVLLIGLGDFGKSIAKNIKSYFPSNYFSISNRTITKCYDLYEELNATIIPYEKIDSVVDNFDIIITAISSPNKRFDNSAFKRPKKRIIIDLSVPGYFHDSVADISEHKLFSLEDASSIVNESLEERQESIPVAESIINQYIHEFEEWTKIYSKSKSISEWRHMVTDMADQCPHFSKISERERNYLLQKSVSRFVTYLKKEETVPVHKETITSYMERQPSYKCALKNTTVTFDKMAPKCRNCSRG
jgi:glutamyl-tRNA reductase